MALPNLTLALPLDSTGSNSYGHIVSDTAQVPYLVAAYGIKNTYWASPGAVLVDNSGVVAISASAALSDTLNNPTVGTIGTNNLVWDGSHWFRMPGSAVGGQWVQGPAAAGAALVGNPLLLGGSDGANIRNIAVDTNGILKLQGYTTEAATAGGFPVRVGGVDGSGNVRSLATDQSNISTPHGLLNILGGLQHAAADAVSNTLTNWLGQVSSYLHGFNGTTWDRLRVDEVKSLLVSFGAKIAGEDIANDVLRVVQRFSATHISSNTTTAVKVGAGILHTIVINTKGAALNTATVYDNTAGSGAVIAIIDTTDRVTTLIYDAPFNTGLTVVTATGTPADLTVNAG